ncbi:glycosyltransferase family 2 protein [Sphingomonas sp. Leaf412]|uniref:glycosyltransferase family 2 protein n=1 Tax=Sphingomonas sp. Leaf412 TaxID=1736370 RepID=UPI000AD66EF4|nr:glycosyltransferase family 2 protein [Sphingomonas sp. Leaf412]
MPQVSVIIPAFDAEATIDATLASATAQSVRDIEIVVVADGCTDATVARVERWTRTDPRVRLIEQANAGVAVARNTGIAAATGAFVAPLDADDLWHPRKLEWQLERFGDPGVGLVYGWYRPIDEQARVCATAATPAIEGRVLHRHLHWNFVGNGSTPLIRRAALDGIAYDPALRAARAGGCEDYLLQLQVARRWRFGCVPAYLTGYRQRAGAMSGDRGTMMRSHVAALRTIRPSLPPSARRVCDAGIARFALLSASAALGRRQVAPAAAALAQALRHDVAATGAALTEQVATIRRARASRGAAAATPGARFDDLQAGDPPSTWTPSATLAALARLDAED